MPDLGTTDKLIFTITAGGQGIASQTPVVVIQKQSNDYYFNGAGYTPTYTEVNMAEVDSANFPGKYAYDFNQALDTTITSSTETYSIRYKNTGTYALTVDEEITFSLSNVISSTSVATPGIEFTVPGFQNPEQTTVVLQNNEKRIKATFVDSNGVYYDPAELNLVVYNPSQTALITETYPTGSTIQRDSAGNYYVDFTQTSTEGEYALQWSWRDLSGGEMFYSTQHLYVINLSIVNLFPNLRNQIDKAQKDLGIFGFTEANLYFYLKGGLSEINRVPPGTGLTFQTYPIATYSQLLIDISTFIALQAQGMCAIDTDSNYSMQGNSFVVDHWS
ncbi:hypothetical protein KAR91_77000, partial [Candidatus Pacearchaeota archaeon]|nr:hypothetical protein [Candidatus Pacearchaeota archaeon]